MNKKKFALVCLIVIVLCIVGKVTYNPANGNNDLLVVHNGEVIILNLNDWNEVGYMFENAETSIIVHIAITKRTVGGSFGGAIGSIELIIGDMIIIGNTPYILKDIDDIHIIFEKL